jgi:hypothetical protein
MSYSISTLLTRNLQDVFGENEPARRRAAIDEIFTEDCVFYDPMGGVYRGRDVPKGMAVIIFADDPVSWCPEVAQILVWHAVSAMRRRQDRLPHPPNRHLAGSPVIVNTVP